MNAVMSERTAACLDTQPDRDELEASAVHATVLALVRAAARVGRVDVASREPMTRSGADADGLTATP